MTQAELTIIVPTRSRPENVAPVIEAWRQTGAFEDGAELLFVIDHDDPRLTGYQRVLDAHAADLPGGFAVLPKWLQLVPKLNEVAREEAAGTHRVRAAAFAIGFAGDDHLPRTHGWAAAYIRRLRLMGTGVVSCLDGYRQDMLPTQWAMTSDMVRALGVMVPAPVEHLYCDDAVLDLAVEAGCYSYLDDHLIEHMHPVAGKAEGDEQYMRVNSRPQYRTDRAAYREWKRHDLWRQAAQIRALREIGATA